MEYIGKLVGDIALFAVRFRAGCLQSLPWRDEAFDCSIVCLRPPTEENVIEEIARAVVTAKTDWVHTLGAQAEAIHDAVDLASVKTGRQANVGDGLPMTSWHDDITDVREMAKFVVSGGLGLNVDYHVVVVVGSEADFLAALDAIRQRYESRNPEDM